MYSWSLFSSVNIIIDWTFSACFIFKLYHKFLHLNHVTLWAPVGLSCWSHMLLYHKFHHLHSSSLINYFPSRPCPCTVRVVRNYCVSSARTWNIRITWPETYKLMQTIVETWWKRHCWNYQEVRNTSRYKTLAKVRFQIYTLNLKRHS